ncbi:MAG: flagellar basal body rod protein FlgC [Clostridia bacterium]|nr:flagellar basal body rod protein FlgC [Clostridia bacterium]
MKLIPGIAISASALTAQKLWMDLIANNIANMNTTRTEGGGPYRRQMPVFRERLKEAMEGGYRGNGVRVERIIEDATPPRMVYNPDHPDADENGFVAMPNINIVNEMIDLIAASRAYEANVTVLNTAKSMALKALEIGR